MTAPQTLPPIGPTPTRPTQRLDFLEGLRALAALWVVLSHLWISQYGLAAQPGRLGRAMNWMLYSHFAVDVFIVLSGFCLALPVLRTGTLAGGAVGFFRRRARRILPPLYAALALSVGLTLASGQPPLRGWTTWAGAVAVNVLLLQDAFLPYNIFNGPLWSVAVEWRIYFLFPLIVRVLQSRGRLWVLAASALVGYGLTAVVLRWFPHQLLTCPWYLFLFALGICAASLEFGDRTAFPPDWRLWPGLAGASLGLIAVVVHAHPVTAQGGSDFGRHMPFADAAVGALTAIGLIRLTHDLGRSHKTIALAFLSWPPLVALGRFSYSLYLTHAPILTVFGLALSAVRSPAMASPMARFVLLLFVGVPVMLGAAYLFFLAIERPCMPRNAPPRKQRRAYFLRGRPRLPASSAVATE